MAPYKEGRGVLTVFFLEFTQGSIMCPYEELRVTLSSMRLGLRGIRG